MDFDNDGFLDLGIVGSRQAPRGPVAERLRKALNQSLALDAPGRTLAEVLKMIRQQQPDLIIQVKDPAELNRKLNVTFTDLSLGAALQLLEDNLPGQRMVVREYGLLIAPEKTCRGCDSPDRVLERRRQAEEVTAPGRDAAVRVGDTVRHRARTPDASRPGG